MVRQASNSNMKGKVDAKPSPTANVSKIGSLKRFADQEHANSLLHEVVKLVAPLLHVNNFKVGTLCEMYPRNPNLLGLNVNRGQKILIRLRYHSNDKLFYPMGDIIGTMLHELTHNLYGQHDTKFFKFLDGLKQKFEELQNGTFGTTNYICEEQKLGHGYNPRGGYTSVRDKRITALSVPKFKAESRRLGSPSSATGRVGKPNESSNPSSMRDLILTAAKRRAEVSKWCPTNHVSDIKDIEPDNEELDIIVVEDEQNEATNVPKHRPVESSEQKVKEYKDVIDLTNEEYGVTLEERDEIIVIDGCEHEDTNASSSKHVKSMSCSIIPNAHDKDDPYNTVVTLGESEIFSNENRSEASSDIIRQNVPGKLLPSFDDEIQPSNTAVETRAENKEQIHTPSTPIQYYVLPSPGKTFVYGRDNGKYPRHKLVADLDFDQILEKGGMVFVSNTQLSFSENINAQPVTKARIDHSPRTLPKTNHVKSTKETSEKQAHKPNAGQKTEPKTSRRNLPRAEIETKRRKGKQDKKEATATQNTSARKTVRTIEFDDLIDKH